MLYGGEMDMSDLQLIKGVEEILSSLEEKEYEIDAGNNKYFKLFVRQPSWLDKQNALSGFFSVDTKTKETTFSLSEYYKRILKTCVRTEPPMDVEKLMKANTKVGKQIEEALPAPSEEEYTPEEEKK